MKKIFATILLLLTIFGTVTTFSQSQREDFDTFFQRSQQQFQQFQEQTQQDFEDFRARTNAEFAEFMSRSWEEFQAFQGIPPPPSPPPIKIPEVDPDDIPTPERQPIDKVIPLPAPEPRPQPIVPIEVPVREVHHFSFLFFNTECRVRLDNSMRFSLRDISERSVAQAWNTLSGNQFNALIADCLALRDRLNLSDWGYKLMIRTMTEQFFGANSSEAVLMQMFLLTQSGYKVRIARAGNRLALLVPFRENIYGHGFMVIGGQRFFIMDSSLQGQAFHVFNKAFPREQFFSWQSSLPNLAIDLNPPRTFYTGSCIFWPTRANISVTVQTNRNLIDFLYQYPITRWDMYANAGLSETVRRSLYPVLQQAIAGRNNLEAAQIFMDFLHHAFDYMTDAEQFGYEKPFFADESFFFPANDCKDRSILFSILVRDLLGLEVVLLHWPGHLGTAVHFPEHVPGDYFIVDGRRFVVADPTFINARIGMTMPQFRGVSANIVRL